MRAGDSLIWLCLIGYGRVMLLFFFFQAEDGIRDYKVTGVQTCALPIFVGRTRCHTREILSGILFGVALQTKLNSMILLPLAALFVWRHSRGVAASFKKIGRASCRERV